MIQFHKKTLFSVLLCIACFTMANAQSFTSFNVEESLFKANIKSATKGASKVEVIVGENVDLKNIKFKYSLTSSSRIEDKISNDFTSPQKTEIHKAADSKEWIIQVKKLQAAKLPLELNFTKTNPSIYDSSITGWASIDTDESKAEVVRFGNQNATFIVAFDSQAKELSYELTLVGSKGSVFDGKFEVEVSADAKKWTSLAIYDSKNPFSGTSDFKNELPAEVRFVKWTYKTRQKQNVNINNIIVN